MSDATSVNSAQDRRWLILGVIGLAQLMVVLDLTVMNIALPCSSRCISPPRTGSGWSPRTRWRSAACYCSAAG
jgi:hypothetical protein